MRRSHFVIAGVIVLLIGYVVFVMSRPGSLARRWLRHDPSETPTEDEPWLEGRPLHEWVVDLKDTRPGFRREAAEVLGAAGKKIPRHNYIGERLAELLADSDPNVRIAAAMALCQVYLWAKAASLQLQEAARDEDVNVRCASLSALALIAGDDEAAFAALRNGFSDRNPEVRLHVVNKLRELEPRSEIAVDLLIEGLKASDPELRRAAIAALAWIGSQAERAALPLCAALKDSDARVRSQAAAALAEIITLPQAPLPPDVDMSEPGKKSDRPPELSLNAKTAIAAAIGAYNDPDPGVRLSLLKLLAKFGDLSDDARKALVSALKDPDAQVRAQTATLVGPVTDAVPQLQVLLEDPDRHIQARAAIALSRMQPCSKAALPPLLRALNDPEDKDRHHAAWALRNFLGQPDQLSEEVYGDIMLKLIRASPIEVDDSEQAPPAIQPSEAFCTPYALVGSIHPGVAIVIVPQLVEELKAAMDDEKPKMAQGLFLALDAIKHPGSPERKSAACLLDAQNPKFRAAIRSAVPLLIDALKGSEDDLRAEALKSLAVMGRDAETAVPALCETLQSRSYNICSLALHAIHELGPVAKDATPCLIELLKARKIEPRYRVVLALGEIGPAAKDAVEPLLQCLHDSELAIRLSALDALKKIDPDAAKRATESASQK
jgi:HEAT repeat protein